MPTGAPRPCTHAGCPNLTVTGKCEAHKHDGWERHQGGRTSTERGYGAAWRKLRARVLSRDKGLCQVCLKTGKYTPAKEVDHIKCKAHAVAEGWSETQIEADENKQSICVPCHKAKTANERLNQSGDTL